jgi:predicted GIY-YIG superfamily endonuclease
MRLDRVKALAKTESLQIFLFFYKFSKKEILRGLKMESLNFVYILQSKKEENRFYTGFTRNIKNRLTAHNQGKCEYTRKYLPWKIKNLFGFTHADKAIEFEKYLKSSSGRAFCKKHF